MKFGPIVCGDGLEALPVTGDELRRPAIQFGCGSVRQLADLYPPALSLDEGHDAVAVARADDRIDLPMTIASTSFDPAGACRDVPLSSQPSPTVIGPVALAPLLAGAPEMLVQLPACGLVRPQVPVDRFMADAQLTGSLEVSGDLFGTPLLAAQEGLDQVKIIDGEAGIPTRGRTPGARAAVRLGRAVGVVCTAIARYLSADRAVVSTQRRPDASRPASSRSHFGDRVSFLSGDLAIRHEGFPFLGGGEKPSVSQITTSLLGGARRVALSL